MAAVPDPGAAAGAVGREDISHAVLYGGSRMDASPPPAAASTGILEPPPGGTFQGWVEAPDRRVRQVATATAGAIGRLSGLTLGLLALVAVLGDLALHTGLSSLVTFLGVLAAVFFVWRVGLATSTQSRALLVGAVALAIWLPVRDSLWLMALNVITAGGLVVTAAVFDQHAWPRLSLRSAAQVGGRAMAGLAAPLLVGRSVLGVIGNGSGDASQQLAPAVLRGLALAAAPVVLIGVLLLQADAILASAVDIDLDADVVLSHAFVIGVVALATAGVVCVGRARSGEDPGPPGYVGGVEAVTILSCLFLLFSAFAGAQLVGAFANIDELLARQQTTHAEYARSGFFQLLGVAALTLIILRALQAVAKPTTGRVDVVRRVLGAGVCLLTVLIVFVSITRLGHYVDAFGQTTLRWYSSTFALLLGVLFVLFAIDHATMRTRPWFGMTSVALVVVTLLAVNVANPERRVAEHNLTEPASQSSVDARYLTGLSADAWPVLLDHRDVLVGQTRDEVDAPYFVRQCTDEAKHVGWGLLGLNLSRGTLGCPLASEF